jgi:hypothetical protein
MFVAVFGATVSARDITTLDGTTYKNVRISSVTPVGFDISYKPEGGGIAIKELFFKNLPENIRKEFHYNAENATKFAEKVSRIRIKREQAALNACQKKLAEQKATQNKRDHIMSVVYSHKKKVTVKVTENTGNGIIGWASLRFASVTTGQLGKVFVMGLGVPQGGEWAGTIYPVGTQLEGYHAFETSLDSAVQWISEHPESSEPESKPDKSIPEKGKRNKYLPKRVDLQPQP